jgi:hypothetical protein
MSQYSSSCRRYASLDINTSGPNADVSIGSANVLLSDGKVSIFSASVVTLKTQYFSSFPGYLLLDAHTQGANADVIVHFLCICCRPVTNIPGLIKNNGGRTMTYYYIY